MICLLYQHDDLVFAWDTAGVLIHISPCLERSTKLLTSAGYIIASPNSEAAANIRTTLYQKLLCQSNKPSCSVSLSEPE